MKCRGEGREVGISAQDQSEDRVGGVVQDREVEFDLAGQEPIRLSRKVPTAGGTNDSSWSRLMLDGSMLKLVRLA